MEETSPPSCVTPPSAPGMVSVGCSAERRSPAALTSTVTEPSSPRVKTSWASKPPVRSSCAALPKFQMPRTLPSLSTTLMTRSSLVSPAKAAASMTRPSSPLTISVGSSQSAVR